MCIKKVIFLILLFHIGIYCFPQPDVRFNKTTPLINDIAVKISFSWYVNSDFDVEYRYKLEMPDENISNNKYPWQEWSPWGSYTNAEFYNLILEGQFRFLVDARIKGDPKINSISYKFKIHFVMPDIGDSDIKINWDRVNAARTFSEKKTILSEEYYQAYLKWIDIYNTERKNQRLFYSGQELINDFSGYLMGNGRQLLFILEERQKPASIYKILTPEKFYDIIKQVGIKIVIVYRNEKTKQAAFNALSAYWAYINYPKLNINDWSQINFPFKISILKYSEKEDLDKYVSLDCGADYRIADWNDLIGYSNAIDRVIKYLDLDETTNKLLVTRNNKHFFDYKRHYFIYIGKHNPPSNFIAHDNIDNYYITLGSWFNVEQHILCIKKSNH